MQRGTDEHIKLMAQFERDVRKFGRVARLDRETGKAPPHVFYQDGHVNELFRAYMYGYSLAKSKYGT